MNAVFNGQLCIYFFIICDAHRARVESFLPLSNGPFEQRNISKPNDDFDMAYERNGSFWAYYNRYP